MTNRTLKMHDNETASAVADQDFKHFVRLRIRHGTATAWVLHVPDTERVAEQFAAHDPRPTLYIGGSSVVVWDRFQVGRASRS